MARDPRWGRVEETYGESPELCGQMGVAYVQAMQTDDLANAVVCTGKHFLGYAYSLGGRNHAPVHLGGRELREVYAAPFATAIRDAGLASMMNSYSSIDGVPVAASRELLTDLLRGELSFDGTVVADYFSVMQLFLNHKTAADAEGAAVASLGAGLDIELPALDCYQHIVPGSTTTPTTVSVPVTNTGDRDGDEVVQLYVTDDVASVARPLRELVGFARVAIAAGETRTVAFTVHPSRLAFHGLNMDLITEPGTFTFRVGRSSFDPQMGETTVMLGGAVSKYERRSIVATCRCRSVLAGPSTPSANTSGAQSSPPRQR